MTLAELYDYADEEEISILDCKLQQIVSISIPDFIGIDTSKIDSSKLEKTILAHELGHCVRGSFYYDKSPYDIKGKHEYRANVWAYKNLLPYDKLMEAVNSGYTEVWEIAEYFDLTEEFTARAIMYYKEQEIA